MDYELNLKASYHKHKELRSFLLLILPSKRKPRQIKHFFHGSFWCYLRSETVQCIIDYLNNPKNRNVIRFYRFSVCSDERLFHTILGNSYRFADHNISRVHVFVRSKGKVWPKLLDEEDFEKIKKSNKLFARKFDYKHSNKLKAKLKKTILN